MVRRPIRGWAGGIPAVVLGVAVLGVVFLNVGCPVTVIPDGPDANGNDNGGPPPDNDNDNFDDNLNDNFDDNDNGIVGPPDGFRDTDGDGFSDDEEINSIPGTDPFDPTDNPTDVRDTDGDGCSDFDELNFIGFCDGNPDSPPDGVTPPDDGDGALATITGTVLVGLNSLIDGDNNDPTNPEEFNDDIATAQSIPNPCTLGGYLGVTRPGLDVTDVFLVQMAAGQAASVLLADPVANDFDLFLYDEAGNPLDSSEGVGRAELVLAPDDGTFVIEVFGFSVDAGDTGGLYTLLIGDNAFGDAAQQSYVRSRISSLHEFAEGEVIVKRVAGADGAVAAKVNDDMGLEVIRGGENAGGFERLRIRGTPPLAKVGIPERPDSRGLRRPESATIRAIKELRRRGDIEIAEPNYIRRPTVIPNDEFFGAQWHYPQINLPAAWDITTGDRDAIVAVIDTGVVLDHPDLEGQILPGFDFISEPDNALDGDGIDPDANDPGDLAFPDGRSTFHGTHVSGTIAARTDNSFGVAGVAWDSTIMPIRVLGRFGGLDSDIVQGIRFAAGLSNDSGTVPDRPAVVINMSLGGPGFSSAEQAAVTAARDAGTIVVVAAGNEQSNAQFFSPAGLDGVVTVSAVGLTRELAPYSNFGDTIELAAPGGDMSVDANADTLPDGVLSTVGDDGGGLFSLSQGTSMASPHVAGVVSLMKAVNREMTPLDFDRLLSGSHPGTSISIVDDLGPAGFDNSFGFGLINALGAVRAAEEIVGLTSVDTPIMQLVPRNLDFGSNLSTLAINVTNGGVGTLSVSNVVSNQPWLSVAPTQGTIGTYTATVDRTGLADGVFSGTVQFVSNGGNLTVTVRMVVGTPEAIGGDIGTIYVLLVDQSTFEPMAQDNITAGEGYEFIMTNIPPGDYLLFAGTDLNDDTLLGDPGEALGGYPTLLDPAIIDGSRDRAGLSMNVSFDINVQAPDAASVGKPGGAAGLRLQRLPTKVRK